MLDCRSGGSLCPVCPDLILDLAEAPATIPGMLQDLFEDTTRQTEAEDLIEAAYLVGLIDGLFTSALPPKADIGLVLTKGAANDPKRSIAI